MPRVLAIVLLIALIVYAMVEVAQADGNRIRLMPRWLWVAAVIALPGVGALAWFLLGRPTRPTVRGRGRPPLAPDDDPDFLRGL